MVRTLALVLALAFVLAPVVLADEPNGEDSAAARLFREAWWLETGVGALDRAKARYEAAAAAEGSEGVRARSLYRLAVVTHRMGETEQAVRTLESLTRTFPAQTKYRDLAKARLEEWSGEDLKEAFGDWYRRYQYSPEFQAKVIDLVLQLGVQDHTKVTTAQNELATIGEPALPALRAHANSANSNLSSRVTRLLFQLGEIPPTEALVATYRWYWENPSYWQTLMDVDDATRARIQQELEGDDRPVARFIRKGLTSRAAMFEAILDVGEAPVGTLLHWSVDTDLPGELTARARAVVLDPDANSPFRQAIAGALRPDKGQVDRDAVLRWIELSDPKIRKAAWSRLHYPTLQGPDTWRLVAKMIRAKNDLNEPDVESMASALFAALTYAPEDDDPKELVDTLNHAMAWNNFRNALNGSRHNIIKSPVTQRGIVDYLMQARGDHASTLIYFWAKTGGDGDEVFDQLMDWATNAQHLEIRRQAMSRAVRICRGAPARLLTPFRIEDRRAELVHSLFNALQTRSDLLQGPWTRLELETLLDVANAIPTNEHPNRTIGITIGGVRHSAGTKHGNDVGTVFLHLLCQPDKRDLILEIAASDPIAFDEDIFRMLPREFAQKGGEPLGLYVLNDHWDRWDPPTKRAALRVFMNEWVFPDDLGPFRTEFLLDRVRSIDGKAERELAEYMLARAGDVSLEDISGVYDLENEEDAGRATKWLNALPTDDATFDAFIRVVDLEGGDVAIPVQPARRGRGPLPQAPIGIYYSTFAQVLATWPEREAVFIRKALANGGATVGSYALRRLNDRSSVEDMELWLKALEHPKGSVRSAAAKGLGRVFNEEGIRALANAVDDPDPNVRDAALESLERIKEIQEQKAYWKKFADDQGK